MMRPGDWGGARYAVPLALLVAVAVLPPAFATTPALQSASLDMNNFDANSNYYGGKLTLTFNTAVAVHTSDNDALGKITIREADNSPSVTLDSFSVIASSATEVVVNMRIFSADQISGMTAPLEILIGANAFKSTDDSTALPAVGDGDRSIPSGSITADTTKPVLVSASFDARTAPAELVIIHSEGMVAGGATGTTAYIASSGSASYAASTDLDLSTYLSATNSRVVSSFSEADRQKIIAMTTPTLYFVADAVRDMTGNKLDAGSLAVSITPDTTNPTLSSAAFAAGTGVLTLTFDEKVLNDTDTTGGVDIRSGASASHDSTTDVRITADPTISNAVATYGQLSEADRQKVISMSDPHVYLDASAVEDTSNNKNAPLTAGTDITVTADATAPALSSATVHKGTGAWSVTFTETVSGGTATGTVLYMASTGSSSYAAATDVALTVPSSSVSSSGNLSEADRQKVISMNTPTVYMLANAVKDTSNVGSAAGNAAASVTADATKPTLSSAAFAAGTGILTLTFSETVQNDGNNTAGSVDIRSGASATYAASTDVRITADPTISNAVAAYGALSEADRQKVISMSDPHVYLAASVIEDTSDNGNAAALTAGTDITIASDTTAPLLSSASVHEGTGAWSATFTETVSAGSASNALYIAESGGSTAYTASTDVLLTVPSSSVSSSGNLTEADRQKVISMTTPTVYVLANAVRDTSSNGNSLGNQAPPVTADTTKPELSAATVHKGTGAWSVTFTETVSAGTASGTVLYMASTGSSSYSATTDVALTVPTSSVSSSGTLSQADRQKVISMTTPTVYAVANAVQDTSSNGIALGSRASTVTADTTAPALSVATVHKGTGAWSVTFTETVSGGTATGTVLYMASSTSTSYTASTDVALSIPSSSASSSGNLSEADRQKVVSMTTPTVYVLANAVKDTSNVAVVAGNTAATVTADTTAPALSAATVHKGTGAWSVTFSETVSAGTATGTVLYMASTGSTSYAASTDVALSVPATSVSSSGNLSEADRQKVVSMNTPTVYAVANAVKDTSDNGIASGSTAATATADTTKPELSSAAFAEGTGVLTLTFDETVRNDGATTDGRVDIRDGAGASQGATSVRITADPGIAAAVATYGALSEADRQKVISMSDPHVYLAASVIEDTSDNLNDAPASGTDITVTADTTAPAIASAEINEGTGEWTVYFTETVSAGTATGTVLYVAESGSSSYSASTDAALSIPSTAVSSTGTLSEAGRQKVIAMTTPTVYAAANGVKDTSDNGIASGSTAPTVQPDSVAPAFSSATLDLDDPATITITFNEKMQAPAAADAARMRVGGGTADVTFAPSDIASQALDPAATTATVTLTEAKRQAMIALDNEAGVTPDLDVLAASSGSAFKDLAGNAAAVSTSNAFATIGLDTTAPTASAAAIDEAEGTVSITFSERVRLPPNPANVELFEAGTTGDRITLDGRPFTADDDDDPKVLTFRLTEAQRIGSLKFNDPRVQVKADASAPLAADTSGNAVGSASFDPAPTRDTTPASVRSVSMNLMGGSPQVTVAFGETVGSLDPTKLAVREASDNTNSVALAGTADLHDEGRQAVIALTEAKRQAMLALDGALELASADGAWQDAGTRAGRASNAGTADFAIDARLITADAEGAKATAVTLDLSASSASFTFDEAIDISEFDASRISVSAPSDGASSVALSGSPSEPDGTSATLALSAAQKARIASASSNGIVYVHASSGAWKDLAGNPNPQARLQGTIGAADAQAPALVYSKLDLSAAPVLELYFDEDVDLGTFDPSKLVLADGNGGNRLALSSSQAPSDESDNDYSAASPVPSTATSKVVLPLTLAQKQSLQSRFTISSGEVTATGAQIDVSAGAWADLSGTANAAAASPPSVDAATADTTKPTLLFQKYQRDSTAQNSQKRLVLTFSEPVDASSVAPASMQVKSQTFRYAHTSEHAGRNAAVAYQNANLPGANCGTTPKTNSTNVILTCTVPRQESRSLSSSNTVSPSSGYASTVEISLQNSDVSAISNFGSQSGFEYVRPSTLNPFSRPTPPILSAPAGTWQDAAGNSNDQASVNLTHFSAYQAQLLTQNLNLESGRLVLTFSGTVDVSVVLPSRLSVGAPGSASLGSGTALSLDPLETVDGTTVTIPLTAAQREALARMDASADAPRVLFAQQNAWDDLGENGSIALVADLASTEDTTPPSLSSASIDLGAGTVSLTFSESVDVSEMRTHLISVSASSNVALSAAPQESADGTTVTIPVTDAQKRLIQAQTGARSISAEPRAWQDTAGNELAARATLASPAFTGDGSAPSFVSASADLGAGTLTVEFSEPVNLADADPGKFSITFAGTTLPAYSLAGASASSAVPGSAAPAAIRVAMTEAQRAKIIADKTSGGIGLSLDAGAVKDLSDNDVAAGAHQLAVSEDQRVPLLVSATLDEPKKRLVMVFDETIDVSALDLAKFHFRNIGESSGGALSDGQGGDDDAEAVSGACSADPRAAPVDSPTVAVCLTDAQNALASGLRVPHLDIDAGAYSDIAGNSPASNVHDNDIIVVQDLTRPMITQVSLHAGDGLLRVEFDKHIDVQPSFNVALSRMYLSDTGERNRHPLTGSALVDLSSVTSILSVRLGDQLRLAAIDIGAGIELDIQEGAVIDEFANRVQARSDIPVSFVPDTAPPRLVSASLDGRTGALMLEFDETVRVPGTPTGLEILPGSGSGAPVRLSHDWTVVTVSPDERMSARLSEEHRQQAAALLRDADGDLRIRLSGTDVLDYAGVAHANSTEKLVYTPDSARPVFQSAVLNLDAGTLSITFDEPVKASSVDVSAISVTEAGGGSAQALTGARARAASPDAATVTVEGIPAATVTDLIKLASPRLALGAGSVSDSSGNGVAASSGNSLRITADSTPPTLESASFDEEGGVLKLVFDEEVESLKRDLIVLDGIDLDETNSSGQVSARTASITLSEAARVEVVQHIDGDPSVRLVLAGGAIRDISANAILAAETSATVTADQAAPSLESASLDLNAGTMTLTFDESVILHDLEGVSAGGHDLAPALDSVAGSGTPTLSVSLSETSRQILLVSLPSSVSVDPGIVYDASGNDIEQASAPVSPVPDTTAPSVELVGLNPDTGGLRIVADEWILPGGQFDPTLLALVGDGVQVTLDGDTINDSGMGIVRLLLTDEDLEAVAGYGPGLRLVIADGAGIWDTSNNALAGGNFAVSLDDPIPPRLLSATVTGPSSILLRFSEDLLDSSVMPSAFAVEGFDIDSASEVERGAVLLSVRGLPEGSEQTVTAFASGVRDNSDNPLASDTTVVAPWRPASLEVLTLELTSDNANPRLAVAGDVLTLRFVVDGIIRISEASVTAASAAPADIRADGFTASWTVPAGAPDGPASFSARVANEEGFSIMLTERDLTGPNVMVDATAPSVTDAAFAGARAMYLIFSEPVLTTVDDYTMSVDGVPVTPSRVFGSGTTTVLLTWLDTDPPIDPPSSTASVSVDNTLRDKAGNRIEASAVTVSGVQSSVRVVPLALGAEVETGSGTAVVTPVPLSETISLVTFAGSEAPSAVALDLSSLSSVDSARAADLCGLAGNPACPTAGTATVPATGVTVETGLGLVPAVVLPDGLEVVGLPADELVRIYEAAAGRLAQALADPDFADDSEVGGYDIAFAQVAELGSRSDDLVFSSFVRVQFDPAVLYSGTLVFSVDSAGNAQRLPSCGAAPPGGHTPDSIGAALDALPAAGPVDTLACVDYTSASVWTRHFTAFGVAPPFKSGSECDDCTAPTLGYDQSGARLVSGGFAYNGLAYDVQHFFTPYPLITSEVGEQNNVTLKIYENSGPYNISHVSVAFGLRSGEAIAESRAVINYDISHDGTGTVSVIDPENSLDPPSASHEEVACVEGSEMRCLLVSIDHSFRAPLEFDIVGTDVWDSERNSWQNYFNHGIRVTGESLNPVPGVRVNGGQLVLHPIVEGSNNVDVMADEDHNLFKLSPDGIYRPLRNASALFHEIDESMYVSGGVPMQGYDRSDPEFAAVIDGQIDLARAILAEMNLGRQSWADGFGDVESSVHVALDRLESLRDSLQAERERAERLHAQLYAPTERPE